MRRRFATLAALAALTLLAAAGSLAFGAVPIPLGEVLAVLAGRGSAHLRWAEHSTPVPPAGEKRCVSISGSGA